MEGRRADFGDHAVRGAGLRSFTCWNCGFESCRGHGWPSVVNVVCCQVEVSASGRSLAQRSPTDCGVSESDRETSIMTRPWSTGDYCIMGKETRERKCAYGDFVVTLEGMRPSGISKRIGDDNIKMYLKTVE